MGLLLTLDDIVGEEVARVGAEEGAAAACSDTSAGKLRVFDLHCDTLDRIAFHGDPTAPGGFAEHDAGVPAGRMASLADNDAHVSLARTAGFAWCQCFAAFVPDAVRGDAAWVLFERVHGVLARELDRCPDKLVQARSMAEVDAALDVGATAAMFTVEGASFLEDDGAVETRLDALAEAGVRMVTLTWNGPNALGSGNDAADGLTAFGRVAVRELERRRIAVDVSHLNDAGFKDVCAVADRPFAASHSNARAICGHPTQPGRPAAARAGRPRRRGGTQLLPRLPFPDARRPHARRRAAPRRPRARDWRARTCSRSAATTTAATCPAGSTLATGWATFTPCSRASSAARWPTRRSSATPMPSSRAWKTDVSRGPRLSPERCAGCAREARRVLPRRRVWDAKRIGNVSHAPFPLPKPASILAGRKEIGRVGRVRTMKMRPWRDRALREHAGAPCPCRSRLRRPDGTPRQEGR